MAEIRTVVAASVLAASMLIAPRPEAQAVEVNEVTEFKGTITDVGVQREPGQIGGVEFRIQGIFRYEDPLDLSKSTITIQEFFVEDGGAGELIKTTDDATIVPTILQSSSSSKSDEAKYETPGRYRPQMRMQIENNQGDFEFQFRLDRGLARTRPSLCVFDPVTRKSYTFITHSFTVDDHVNPPLDVSTTQKWECMQPGRYHMRAR